ncbi:MAG: PD40 domain-containing protein [Bacteroidaceae bacterium]|nr:PD40 domain-containing protein [Bacteroidaceae bacterium]
MNYNLFTKICAALLCATLFAACTQPAGTIARTDDAVLPIYPDYREVTIPCNIAPLNFSVLDTTAVAYALQLESDGQTLWVEADGTDFCIPQDAWAELISTDAPKQITLTIARREAEEWVGGRPFTLTVMPDSIDDYLTYRLVPPGYSGWYKMGIYQHQLSTSTQEVIFENSHTEGNCVNCHTVGSHRADRTLLHMRTAASGTYLFRDGTMERLNTLTDSLVSAFVYPAWHPGGRFIAFSTNKTAQNFHTAHPQRIEVFDDASDIVVYDADTHEVLTTPLLLDGPNLQTYPTFSPDGRWLYFCSATVIPDLDLDYDKVHYALCRVAFDADNRTFGATVDTLYSRPDRSVSFPRVSPDGRWLVCTLSAYGQFSIWHTDADLYALDLQQPDSLRALAPLNSPQTESYHSWSSNGRWLVFSSRRDDGLYTRPYFAYIDAEGQARKPFMLPQHNPRLHYAELDFSYNIPELMTSRFSVSMRDILDATEQEAVPVRMAP